MRGTVETLDPFSYLSDDVNYRERGRRPEECRQLIELAGKPKPLMIQSLVTSFQRTVDRTIRRSVPGE